MESFFQPQRVLFPFSIISVCCFVFRIRDLFRRYDSTRLMQCTLYISHQIKLYIVCAMCNVHWTLLKSRLNVKSIFTFLVVKLCGFSQRMVTLNSIFFALVISTTNENKNNDKSTIYCAPYAIYLNSSHVFVCLFICAIKWFLWILENIVQDSILRFGSIARGGKWKYAI